MTLRHFILGVKLNILTCPIFGHVPISDISTQALSNIGDNKGVVSDLHLIAKSSTTRYKHEVYMI